MIHHLDVRGGSPRPVALGLATSGGVGPPRQTGSTPSAARLARGHDSFAGPARDFRRGHLVISAGRGPEPCRALVARLGSRLITLAEQGGLGVDAVLRSGPAQAPRSMTLVLVGPAAAVLADELGVHALVDRAPGRRARKRWFVEVRLECPVGPTPSLDPADVEVTATRSGGPGGQHVQKTSSAVRATHRPTGLSVRVEGARSQHQNRARALEVLARAVAARAQVEAEAHRRASHRAHHALERGRPVRTWRLDRTGEQLIPG